MKAVIALMLLTLGSSAFADTLVCELSDNNVKLETKVLPISFSVSEPYKTQHSGVEVLAGSWGDSVIIDLKIGEAMLKFQGSGGEAVASIKPGPGATKMTVSCTKQP